MVSSASPGNEKDITYLISDGSQKINQNGGVSKFSWNQSRTIKNQGGTGGVLSTFDMLV